MVFHRKTLPHKSVSNVGMPFGAANKQHHHAEEDDEMRIWRRSVRWMVLGIVAAFVLSIALGYVSEVQAQAGVAERQAQATQLAVDDQRLTTMEASQTRVLTRLDTVDTKLQDLSERLASMQGMGTGAAGFLTLVNLLGIGFQIKNRKPSA
jgi:hypothetical protein